jgi:hypothetical protein
VIIAGGDHADIEHDFIALSDEKLDRQIAVLEV